MEPITRIEIMFTLALYIGPVLAAIALLCWFLERPRTMATKRKIRK